MQQLREAFPYDESPRYLIFDRDSIFDASVVECISALGTKPRRISYRRPWQNGTAERWIGTCRRELLDHVVVLGEQHLIRLVRKYISYYHEDRCHLSLNKDAPNERAVTPLPITSLEILGRLVLATHIGVISPLLKAVSSWPLAWRDYGPVGSVANRFRSAPDQ